MYNNMSPEEINQEVIKYSPLVKKIAFFFLQNKDSGIQEDDMIQEGYIGLLEAIDKYDPSYGATFQTYATIRIRGSMLDSLRKIDWTTRSIRKKIREIEEATTQLNIENKRETISALEISKKLNITIEEYNKTLNDKKISHLVSYDLELKQNDNEDFVASGKLGPEKTYEHDETSKKMLYEISCLNKIEQNILYMLYSEDKSYYELGKILNVSGQTIKYRLDKIILKLRRRLSELN